MNISIGADHRGFDVATRLAEFLRAGGHTIDMHVPPEGQSSDYPETAWLVGTQVSKGAAEMGLLVCGTGVGMCIAANKVPGIRAASVHDELTAELSRSHNDANVICLSADLLGLQLIERIVDLCIRTPFSGGRHARRIEKVALIEDGKDPRTWKEHAAAG